MTQVTSSTPADSEPCMCGRTTLVTLVSMTCITVTSMAESVMSHFCAPENSPTAAAAVILPKLDGDDRGHARAQRVGIAELAGVEADLHGQALDHFHPVARGVLGGQQREARARARGERVHRAAEDAVGEGVHADLRAHAGPDPGELRLLEVREDPDLVQRHDGEERLAHLRDLPQL